MVRGLWAKYEDLADSFQRKEGLITPEQGAQRWQAYEQMMQEFRQVFTPSELEEFELRLISLDVGDVWGSERLFDCVLSGAELRELLRIRKTEPGPLAKIFLEDDLPDTSLPVSPEQESKTRTLLGEQRYQGYQLAQDTDFRWVHPAVQELSLPMEKSWAVFKACQTARDALRQYQADPELTEAERAARGQHLLRETESAIKNAVGPDKFHAFMTKHRDLLQRVTGGGFNPESKQP